MNPLNGKNTPLAQMSSDLVSWQGPDIPCLNLCRGDSVSQVVHKLATKLCNLLESLDVSNYDLTCLNLGECPPETFQQLIQTLIEAICTARDTPGPSGTNGTNGNYVVTAYEPAGANCANGGVRIRVLDGTTNLVLETRYVCNGLDGAPGAAGIPLPPVPGPKGEDGENGLDGAPSSITFQQDDNCEIVVTEVQGAPDYVFTLSLQDSGWLDISGCNHYEAGVPKPQVRKIGNQLHFKGTLILPLSNDTGATLISLATVNGYDNQPYTQVYTGAGGVNVITAGGLQINKGASVLPNTLDLCGKTIDGTYQKQYISSRQILVSGGNGGVSLSAPLQLTINSSGVMTIQTLLDIEQSALAGGSYKGGSALRYITSKVVSGDQVPDYTDAQSMLHHNPNMGVQNAMIDYQPRTFLFDCDAGQPEQLGGFFIRLEGLTAFLS